MIDQTLLRLVGNGVDDPGCEQGFLMLESFVEAVVRGEEVTPQYAALVHHLENCADCREDVEGIIAALREIEVISPVR